MDGSIKSVKRFACGFKWSKWSIGVEVHNTAAVGTIIELSIFPLIMYLRVSNISLLCKHKWYIKHGEYGQYRTCEKCKKHEEIFMGWV